MANTTGDFIAEGNWQAVEDSFNNMPFVKRLGIVVSLADPDFSADLDLLGRLRTDGIGIVKLKTGTKTLHFAGFLRAQAR